MTRKIGAVAFAATLLSTTALQAVTADEVWAAWQKEYAAYGFQIATGDQGRQGDTLVISDVRLSNATPDAELQLSLPEVRLRDQGDGTVEVTLSRELTGVSRATPEEGEPVELDLHLTQTNSRAVVSGTPDDLAYRITAPVVVMDMVQSVPPASADSGAVDLSKVQPPLKMQLTASGIDGDYRLQGADDRRLNSTITVKSAQIVMTSTGAQAGQNLTVRGDVADLSSHSGSFAPQGANLQDLNAALSKGARIDTSATYGASTWTIESTGDKGLTTVTGVAKSGDFAMTMAPEAIHYAATAQAPQVTAQLPGVPVPFSGTLEGASFDITVPMRKSDTPQPFIGKVGLTNLTLSDQVWALFDPKGVLPHTPATLALDLDGTARPVMDLFSAEAATQQQLPVQVDSLNLNRLQVTAAGADLSGTGAVTFDSAAGAVVPDGAVDLRLAGANGLMEKLGAMQLVPQDQMMFVRMLLGLYAVAAGDDLYTSKIEFKSGGEILANGQRIR